MKKKYLDVKAYLLEQIQSGSYRPDEPLPPERELAALLGINRMTLRRAVDDLMYDGLLIRKKGSGTFLTKSKISKTELIGDDTDSEEGSIKVINCRLYTDGSYGHKALGMNPEDHKPYWRLRRIRMMNMIPYAYEDIYLRETYFKTVDYTYYHLGLRRIVREKAGLKSAFLSEQVEALLCLHNTAILLNVKEESPILQIKSTFESEKEIVMFCRSYHPGDSYSYRGNKQQI